MDKFQVDQDIIRGICYARMLPLRFDGRLDPSYSSRKRKHSSCSPWRANRPLLQHPTATTHRNKSCLYRHQDHAWVGSKVSGIRRTSTVILDKRRKLELLEDIEKFLNPISQRWYSSRGIPYPKGYLLYGPPGTGKSSLSLSIAGHFGLDIYILNLSSIN